MRSRSLDSRNVYARVVVLLAIVGLAAVSPASAQTGDRRVEGTVVDSQGLPILGAELTLIRAEGNLSRTASSSTERFRFENLAPGAYMLRVTATGFQQQQIQIDLRNESSRIVDIRMEPAGITEQTVV